MKTAFFRVCTSRSRARVRIKTSPLQEEIPKIDPKTPWNQNLGVSRRLFFYLVAERGVPPTVAVRKKGAVVIVILTEMSVFDDQFE